MVDKNNTGAGGGGGAVGSVGVDVSAQDFMAEVIESSQHQPVVVDFWAPWCGPCKQLMPLLEAAVKAHKGAVKLAKVNIDENQAIAAQLRVQSVPTVYAFYEGRAIDGFAGMQSQSAIEAFISKLAALSPAGMPDKAEVLEAAEAAFGLKNFSEASALFNRVLAMDEENSPEMAPEIAPEVAQAMSGLLRCFIASGDLASAEAMVAGLTDDMQQPEVMQKAIAALATARAASESAGRLGDLQASAEAQPDAPAVLYALAEGQFGAGQTEAAIETLLKVIKIDRGWNDDAGRLKLLEIFDILGASAPEVVEGRRKLSALLFA